MLELARYTAQMSPRLVVTVTTAVISVAVLVVGIVVRRFVARKLSPSGRLNIAFRAKLMIVQNLWV
ncbi:MAG TPA: hypothetical protein VKB53_04035, partial [Gammaproteobacteria bacterium]|jgi:hypothetical protein|nr:hypothetical protein [Gammaproteobacteria bacterium]